MRKLKSFYRKQRRNTIEAKISKVWGMGFQKERERHVMMMMMMIWTQTKTRIVPRFLLAY